MPGLDPGQFYEEALLANDIDTAFGVPDTNLSGLLTYLSATQPVSKHIVPANEGAAVALAAGYYLSTSRVALVYMQNSGLANALNPLQSIASKEVFGIPMLLLIGWAGRSGKKEELQDILVGPRLLDNLQVNNLPYEEVLDSDSLPMIKDTIARLVVRSLREKTPVALIVPRQTFAEPENIASPKFPPSITAADTRIERWISWAVPNLPLAREGAIRCVLGQITPSDASISSLGGNSRELYMIRKMAKDSIARNFFCIGAMGHAYALAFGVAMKFTSGRVFCVDGDGSFMMHAGNNAILAGISPPNLIHIVIYNGVHASTGNHPLTTQWDNIVSLVQGLPYRQKFFVDDAEGLEKACSVSNESTIIVVAVNAHSKRGLAAPSESPQELKTMFMRSLL
jgi:phosphonopyruvate decarboxylase